MYGGMCDDGVWSLLFEKVVKIACYIYELDLVTRYFKKQKLSVLKSKTKAEKGI